MAGLIRWATAGTFTTLLTTELNSLAASGRTNLGTEFDNTSGLYLFGDFQADVEFAVAPVAGTMLSLFLVPALDGTNYADGSSSVTNVNAQRGQWSVRGVDSDQVIVIAGVVLPPAKFKIMVQNDTGQALEASGNTVKMLPYSEAYT